MPNYNVTIVGGCFEVEADDEDAAREKGLEECVVEIDLVEEEDDEDDDEIAEPA